MGKAVKFVYIPVDMADPLQQWELPLEEGADQCAGLLDRLKEHFRTTGPAKTAAQQQAQISELMGKIGPDAKIDATLLNLATSMNMVENVGLLSNAADNGFIGVNLYVDDEGRIKGLPTNMRASEIAHCCGKPLDVKGDAFLARVFDNGDDFERLDLLLEEVSSSADWVRKAKAQNERKRREELDAQGLVERMRQVEAQQQQPRVRELTPGEAAKDTGNAAFKRGAWQEAVDHYSQALALDAALAAARNNRAMALLKLQRWAEAEADCSTVLEQDPGNVKALLRRAAAWEGQGQPSKAVADLEEVVQRQPQNKEAVQRLAALRPNAVDVAAGKEQVQPGT